tara:strand:- start:227 stop:403 length:177 start_codon:yes stop_codon:yes gene_type:complete
MIYLVLVGLLGLGQLGTIEPPFQADTIQFQTHSGKEVSHNNKVIYTKAPTAWVKLINN